MNKIAGVDWGSVAKMLAGGAMLGTGAGAAVTFLNHLKELQSSAKLPSEDGGDSNVLYLELPSKRLAPQAPARMPYKRASSANPNTNTASTFALSSLAGLVGSALAYNTVRDVYNRRRKREVENDLSNAQHIYLNQLPATKVASQYSMPTKMVGTGYLALLLTALGSAVVANKMLQKRFPPLQNPTSGQPRKIVIRSVDPVTHKPLTEGHALNDVSPDAVEGVVRTQMANTKMAARNDLVNVVHAVASGRGEEIKELIKYAGVDGMLDAVKGSSTEATDPVLRNIAITWICNDPLVKEALAPTIAAEFFKNASWTFELLPRLSDLGFKEASLIGLVEASTRAVRANTLAPVMEKMALTKAAEEPGVSPLKTLFFAGALNSIMDPRKREAVQDQTMNTMVNEESPVKTRKYHHGIDLEIGDDDARRFAQTMLPAVDKTLARNS
jgi:hypothetical protein